jgi:hypothetical protein
VCQWPLVTQTIQDPKLCYCDINTVTYDYVWDVIWYKYIEIVTHRYVLAGVCYKI